MTERIIRPEDVSAADAKTILDFLNSAETAQQIADRIELPNEPDVGPRLAAAILQHRTQLEGFRSLADLDAVKGIGPVRFTRIVESLVGAAPQPVDPQAFAALVAQVAALQSRLDALKVQAGGAGPQIALRAVEAQRYLGQPTTLIATVTGPDGLRAIGVPVTLTATWGRLRGSDGFSVQEGGSVTFRTAGDGTVRATLVPPTSEDLEASQQTAIEAMLAGLDPAAPTPREAANELTALVGAYRFDANDDLRAGIDIYFRDFHQHLVDRVNFRDELDSWPTFDSLVAAYVQADSTVQASAVLVVQCRDWLGAWLQTHVDAAGAQTLLGGELELATNLEAPADMLSRIHQRVGEFVSLQTGVVGQVVAQKVADAKLTGFLQNGGLDRLPEEHKQALFPAVDTSSNTVATLGVQALGAIEQTRTDLRQNVDAQIQAAVPQAIEHSPAITNLQTAVAAKVDQTTFDQQIASKVDITTLNQKLSSADDFSAFKTSLLPVLIIPPIHILPP